MHPRNRHTGRYDFDQLILTCPDLAPFVSKSRSNEHTIDFANPEAVKTLNRALLKCFYGVSNWQLPDNYLCPPIPGRADYVHHLADLLSSCNDGKIPRGDAIHVLDIGVGANCIYPIIGHCEYGWSFLGSDIDPIALGSAKQIVKSNQNLTPVIELRIQSSPPHILKGLLKPHEFFDVSLSNPPFHASLEEAQEGSRRKWKNLGHERTSKNRNPLLNFGGQGNELWCKGGEVQFISRMIQESLLCSTQVFWFSTLVSKESNLPKIQSALKKAGVIESRTLDMAQGQKKSRIVAWTFLTKVQQKEWRMKRWASFN